MREQFSRFVGSISLRSTSTIGTQEFTQIVWDFFMKIHIHVSVKFLIINTTFLGISGFIAPPFYIYWLNAIF